MINGNTIFDQPVKNDLKTIDIIQKLISSQGDDNKTGCRLDYAYFKELYKMIATKAIC